MFLVERAQTCSHDQLLQAAVDSSSSSAARLGGAGHPSLSWSDLEKGQMLSRAVKCHCVRPPPHTHMQRVLALCCHSG